SNSQSTSYAVQGLIAAGSGGGAVSRAQSYLVKRQRADGSVAYSSSSTQTPVWVTAQALMALEGKALPLGTVARKRHRRARASNTAGGGAAAGDTKAKGGKNNAAAGADAGTEPGAAAAEGVGAAGGAAATGEPGVEPEGTSAATLAAETAKKSGTAAPKPVPLWAGVLAAIGLVALLWALHTFVLPRRPDLG
ncbi:MAG TPA: hypothetical protein VGO83_14965, partial [Thermoleophilaceae bacterium]|nr:hypothetical protein [Thermoleophilaceae bacterium]